ncbi:cupin domain-containing protein [Streptomyces sp. VRA16 Mangrove soil]|nr:cupin domain-containing protein [Streptomyces sp. VRA16 Mangrove soil]
MDSRDAVDTRDAGDPGNGVDSTAGIGGPDTPVSPDTPGGAAPTGGLPNLRDLLTGKAHDHGGEGTIRAYRAFSRAPEGRGAAFVDLAVLPPGTSIGRHRHGADRETYIVLNGSGLMFRDGERFRVRAGDIVVNRPYGEHGLVNDGTAELRLLVFEEPLPAATAPEGVTT